MMPAPNWTTDLVEPVLAYAEGFAAAFLRALLVRLEAHPEVIPAIRAAVGDHGAFLREVIQREAEGNDKAAATADARLAAILEDHRARKK